MPSGAGLPRSVPNMHRVNNREGWWTGWSNLCLAGKVHILVWLINWLCGSSF